MLAGNTDTSTVVSHRLVPAIFATQIRILPHSEHRRTVCLRIELRGCKDTGEWNMSIYREFEFSIVECVQSFVSFRKCCKNLYIRLIEILISRVFKPHSRSLFPSNIKILNVSRINIAETNFWNLHSPAKSSFRYSKKGKILNLRYTNEKALPLQIAKIPILLSRGTINIKDSDFDLIPAARLRGGVGFPRKGRTEKNREAGVNLQFYWKRDCPNSRRLISKLRFHSIWRAVAEMEANGIRRWTPTAEPY